MTHSELLKVLLSDSDQEDDEDIDGIIDSVSTFKYVGLLISFFKQRSIDRGASVSKKTEKSKARQIVQCCFIELPFRL